MEDQDLESQNNLKSISIEYQDSDTQNNLKSNNMDYETYFEMGVEHKKNGEKNEALECFNKAIELNPNYAQAYFTRGNVLRDLGQKSEALQSFNKTIELNKYCTSAYVNKGNLLQGFGQDNEALECYNKAIELDPEESVTYHNKAISLSNLGQENEALECLNIAIELNPNYSAAYCRKGEILEELGQENEALECYNRAIELNPSNSVAYKYKGFLLQETGKYNEALECCNKAIELNPNYYDAYNNKGLVLQHLGYENEALECYDELIELNPNYSYAYYNKGNILTYLDLGQMNEALYCFNKVIELNPSFILTFTSRARLYKQIGDIQQAIQDIKQAALLLNQGHTQKLTQGNIWSIQNTIKEFEEVEKTNKQITEKIQLIQGKTQEKIQLNQQVNKIIKILTNKVEQNIVEQITNQVQINENIQPQKKEDLQKINDQLKQENLENQKILEQLEQQLQQKDLTIQDALKLMQQRLENVENDIKNSGLKDAAQLNIELKALQKEQDVFGYYHTFYWTSLNTLLTYRILSTGLIQANYKSSSTEFLESNKETISEGIKIGLDVGKEICKETIKAVPIVGDIFSYIDKVVDIAVNAGIAYQDKQEYTQFQNRVNIISKIIMKKFQNDEEISRQVAQAAIQLAKLRKNDIRNPVEQEEDKADLKTKIFDKISEIENKFFAQEKLHDKSCIAIQLALKDVSLLISYLCQNSQSIIDRTDTINEIFVNLIQTNTIENQLNKNPSTPENQVDQEKIEDYNDQNLSKPQNEVCQCQIF